MNRPFRENLALDERLGVTWVICASCGHAIAPSDRDWHPSCTIQRLAPKAMGPHRELLEGRLVLEEHYCPNCGVTVDANVVEADVAGTVASNRPARRKGRKSTQPSPVSLEGESAAVIVLDLHVKACEPTHVGHSLVMSVPPFLVRARAAGARVIFIVPAWDKGLPEDRIAEPMARRIEEPVLYPHAYDKFNGGEMFTLLENWKIKTLVFVGGSANFSLLYTATTAARIHGYSVVIPVDGIYAHSDYELEYALFQFTVLPRVANKFRFSTLQGIQLSQTSS